MEGLVIKDYVLKYFLFLVGYCKIFNDVKRYIWCFLVVVYYSVDFGFDYRVGEGFLGFVWRVGYWEFCF